MITPTCCSGRDYDSFKKIINEYLKLNGIYEQSGGDKKTCKTDSILISWRKTNSLLHLEGTEAGSIRFFAKICNNAIRTSAADIHRSIIRTDHAKLFRNRLPTNVQMFMPITQFWHYQTLIYLIYNNIFNILH